MKSLVIYFSQTGNTRKIAKCIGDGIIDVTGQCDLTNLNDVDLSRLSDYNLVGIGCPVFYYKEPFNVSDFVEALPQLEGQHWFIFCTHGNVLGNFFPSMSGRLHKKGAAVIGCHDTYANITVPYYPSPDFTAGHPDEYDFDQAKAFGREIARRSPQIADTDSDLLSAPIPVSSQEWVQEADRLTADYLGQIMPKLVFDKDRCSQCHACEKGCPVQGIEIEADPPRLQNPCIYCLHCVNICPSLAISANWDGLVKIALAYHARYRKELDKAAARGEFRWLINPETINCNDPLYQQRARQIKKAGGMIVKV